MAEKKTAQKAAPKTVKTGFMSVKELRAQSVDERATHLAQVQKDLADARRRLAAGELVNPQVIGKYRREIARLKTIAVEQANVTTKEGDA